MLKLTVRDFMNLLKNVEEKYLDTEIEFRCMNDCEVGKLEDMIEWIDEGGFVVNVFDVERRNNYDYDPDGYRMKNDLKYDEEKNILFINLNSKEYYVGEPENDWKEEKRVFNRVRNVNGKRYIN